MHQPASPPQASDLAAPRPLRTGLGLVLLISALVLGPNTLAGLSSDGDIAGLRSTVVIAAVRIVMLLVAAWLVWPWCRAIAPRTARSALLLVVAGGSIWALSSPWTTWADIRYQEHTLAAISRSEDLIQWITTKMPRVNDAVMNLRLPGSSGASMFADEVAANDLAASPASAAPSTIGGVGSVHSWPVDGETRSIAVKDLALWQPFFSTVHHLEHGGFYIIRGSFDEDNRYHTDMGFSAVAEFESGDVAQISAKLHVVWQDNTPPDAKEPLWLAHEWSTVSFKSISAPRFLFTETLDVAIPDADTRKRARQSLHEQLVVRSILEKEDFVAPPFFNVASVDRHPGITVTDLDRDGFDDIYLMARWGKNMLLRNRGDGTFEDIAPELGLDIENHTSCAIFADFDNDGDSDAVLGRTLAASMYLENVDGRFVDRSSEVVKVAMPYLVSSIAATDYDGDGLLDIYFSTIGENLVMPDLIGSSAARHPTTSLGLYGGTDEAGEETRQVSSEIFSNLSEEDSATLRRLYTADYELFLDRPGPPNLLLKNDGGTFSVSPANASVQLWRNTFQSTFADYDSDGDPDLYCAHDFAPNDLLRNDGGKFVNVTEESRTADIGFGMGATWGDYDNDGAQDLYVTNMYSKAGRRIMAQISVLDPRFGRTAGGNSLFRQGPEHFDKVSGMEPPAMMVEKAGWSWGAQFIDFDNDSNLDLYAPNGFYTAPKQLRVPVDT